MAIEAGVPVIPVPGPTALIAALAAGGLPTFRFAFEGFPPREPEERAAYLASLQDLPHTLVFYESPRRLRATLHDLRAALGNRRAVLARDLTCPTEQLLRGTLDELIAHFTRRALGGQCVLLVEGTPGDRGT
jgi:16S rRNA (cytidine1402-2'-O)-methyltransferase